MTDAQATARRMLKKNQQYLSTQQMKTLNGLIKSGDITGAMNGPCNITRNIIRFCIENIRNFG